MERNNSLTQLLETLKQKGYTYGFFRNNNCIYCKEPALNFHTHELAIEEVFRHYEPGKTPGSAIVYTIESARLGIKGLLLNNY